MGEIFSAIGGFIHQLDATNKLDYAIFVVGLLAVIILGGAVCYGKYFLLRDCRKQEKQLRQRLDSAIAERTAAEEARRVANQAAEADQRELRSTIRCLRRNEDALQAQISKVNAVNFYLRERARYANPAPPLYQPRRNPLTESTDIDFAGNVGGPLAQSPVDARI